MKNIWTFLALGVLIASGVFLAVNRNASDKGGSGNQVAVSFYPLYDFARNIGGDKVDVMNITPAGTEPHDYEPSPRVIVDAQKSKLFVYNGGHIEPWVEGFLADYKNITVRASQDIELINDDGLMDPHFWLDPALVQKVVDNIAAGLSQADPANSHYYRNNADKYKAELAKLDSEFREGLMGCKHDTVISSHDAFGYLGKRYGINIVSIAGLSPEQEPSAAKLAEISQLVKQKGLKYIFFESLVSSKLADTIAKETGAKTLVFNPIEGLTNDEQKQGKDYIAIQRENLDSLRIALACQ